MILSGQSLRRDSYLLYSHAQTLLSALYTAAWQSDAIGVPDTEWGD